MKSPDRPRRASLIATLILLVSSATAASAVDPVARDDYAVATDRYLETVNGVETYSILIDVLANDEDAHGEPLEVVIQGDFGLPPTIWIPDPVGTVDYLGAGLFELTFGKEELGDATEVTFRYELEDAATLATVRVAVAGEGPAPEVVGRDDEFVERGACWIRLPVLANDTGLDTIESFTQPSDGGLVQRDSVEPHVLIYRGRTPGTFTYTATSSLDGSMDSATVEVNAATLTGHGDGEIKMADCFNRDDGVDLGGQTVEYWYDLNALPRPSWTAGRLIHLDRAATHETALPGESTERRKGYLPFDGDGSVADDGTAFQIEGTFRADPSAARWVALAFTHGNAGIFNESDLWMVLKVDTGELELNGRWGGGFQERLGSTTPQAGGYTFLEDGVNHLRLRYDSAAPVPWVDAWINGTRALSVPFEDEQGNPVAASEITGAIENAGFAINYGTNAADPGDVWFDDFELWVGDVSEPRLAPKTGDPQAGADVDNGATLSMSPLHLGCTTNHSNCYSNREKSIWLSNEGNEALEVTHLNFEGSTDWTLVTPSLASFSIPAGGSEEIRVRVDALELGSTAGRLELTTSDDDLPKLVVNFAAEVTHAPRAELVHYCSGLECSFDGGSSTGVDLSQSVYNYTWSLDGQFRTWGPTFDHTFATSGVHTVRLRVSDATGAQHYLERTVSLSPDAAFTSACSSATRICDFDAGATSDGVVAFRYELGDGTVQSGSGDPGGVLVRHAYATSGRYDVTLVVEDGDGQEASVTHEVVLSPVPDFTASCSEETVSCDFDASASTPQMVLYEWSLGDGAQATGLEAIHSYATSGLYSVTLTVVDQAGQIEVASKLVSVPPRADFTVTCAPDLFTCSFDGSASTPGVGHEWDFGDGSAPASGAVQEHDYGVSGVFTATLTVTDASGQTASSSRQVALPPKAELTVSCDGFLCQFDASSSSPGLVSYAWDFGHDGATATGVAPSHEFPDAGDYEVTLAVTDGSNQTATNTETVTVFDEQLLLLILLDRR